MWRLAALAISVGLADSINPSTVGPALYLATTRGAVAAVTRFTVGVLAVNLVAGVALTVGPAHELVDLIPHPAKTIRHLIELAAGIALVALAIGLWMGRRHLARRALPMSGRGGRSALYAGASIAAVELPTAAPYLAIIAAIAASDGSVPQQIILVAAYCLAFVAPLLAILAVLLVAGERAAPALQRCGDWLQRRWPVVLAAFLLLVGGGLAVAGGSGLVRL